MSQRVEMYVPVLKTKATSFRALKALKPGTKSSIIPFLEVAPDTEQNLVANLKTYWDGLACYLDFVFLDGDGVGEVITSIVHHCRKNKQSIILVTGPDRTEEYRDAVKKNSEDADIAIRFSISSLSSDMSEKIIKASYSFAEKAPGNIHAFLDMESVKGGSEYYAVNALLPTIFDTKLARTVLISGSFPDSTVSVQFSPC